MNAPENWTVFISGLVVIGALGIAMCWTLYRAWRRD